jgi:hypothetical protein
MRICFIVYILSFFFARNQAQSQEFLGKDIKFTAGINIGYTFHAGMNFGFVIDAGLPTNSLNNLQYGLSASYYFVWINDQDRFHRIKTINLMAQNDFFDFKLGRGRARNGWGYENRNRCRVRGWHGDLSVKTPSEYSPQLGYKFFFYNHARWAWFEYYYNSIYLNYERQISKTD